MANIHSHKGFTIIRRHWFIMIFRIFKFVTLLIFAYFLYWLYVEYLQSIAFMESIKYVYEILLFLFVNYIFFSFIFGLIRYFGSVIIIYDDQIVIIKCTLLLKDDIEVIDAYRVMKFDSFQRGLLSNIIGYWDITLEQQKNDVRTFHFIPDNYKVLSILKIQREKVLENRNNINN